MSEQIVFYYFKQGALHFVPAGSVLTPILLFTASSDKPYTSDTAADLRTALELVLHDAQNRWISSDLEIVGVTFGNGHADVVLEGDYFAMGDAQPCAASLQILMTVFANPSVQTATVTLNGGLIGNRCFFGPPNSANYLNDDVYTRAEIETFMNENAYVSP